MNDELDALFCDHPYIRIEARCNQRLFKHDDPVRICENCGAINPPLVDYPPEENISPTENMRLNIGLGHAAASGFIRRPPHPID